MVARFKDEMIALDTHPGNITRTVGAPTPIAVAVSAPLAGKQYFKPDCTAQAAALD